MDTGKQIGIYIGQNTSYRPNIGVGGQYIGAKIGLYRPRYQLYWCKNQHISAKIQVSGQNTSYRPIISISMGGRYIGPNISVLVSAKISAGRIPVSVAPRPISVQP
jgi:hypothetical protein